VDKVSIGTFEQRHISMLILMIDGADAMQAKQKSGLSSLDGGDSPRKGEQRGLERHLAIALPVFIFGVIGLGVYVHRLPG
jgi:hypothetical protein